MRKNLLPFMSGGGIGALIGILIGLSASSVVSVAIGSITAVLITLLDLKKEPDGDIRKVRESNHMIKVMGFGFFATIFCLLGLFLRANNIGAPSITSQVQKWTNAGYMDSTAKVLVIYENLGLAPKDVTVNKTSNGTPRDIVLFSSEYSPETCTKIKSYNEFDLSEQLKAYRDLGGLWARLADSVSIYIEPPQQKLVLDISSKCICSDE